MGFGNGKIAMAGAMLAGQRGGIKDAVRDAFDWSMRQPELNEVVQKHMTAFRENTATPNAATMRAFATEVPAVLDQPR